MSFVEEKSVDLHFRSLNGDMVCITFENDFTTVLDLFIHVWKVFGISINHMVLYEDKNDKNSLVLSEVHNEFDYLDRKFGAFRVIRISQFKECSILCLPKRRKLVVYLNHKDKKINHMMCLDLNDLSFHRPCTQIEIEYGEGWGWGPSSSTSLVNENVWFIDIDSFLSYAISIEKPDMFNAGSKVFQSTIDRIDDFISHYIRGYRPSCICKVQRKDFSVKSIVSVLSS